MSRRRKKPRNKSPRKDQKRILVICVEGETEENYIKYLNSLYRTGHKIRYEIKSKFSNNTKSYVSQIAQKYGVNEEDLILVYDLENSQKEYNKFISNNKLIHEKTYLIQPCIEYHFLLHHSEFLDSTNLYREGIDVVRELKNFLPQYRKGRNFSWQLNGINIENVKLAKVRAIQGFKSFNQNSFSMLGKFIDDNFIE